MGGDWDVPRQSRGVNKGIVANQVTSHGPMAVGDRARAVQTGTNFRRESFIEELTTLRKAVEAASLPANAKSKMVAEIDALEAEARERQPDRARLNDGLMRAAVLAKSIREIFGNAAGLIEPIRKLAGVIDLGLESLGVL
jgi:hypothetical protein